MAAPRHPHPVHDGSDPGFARALWIGMALNLCFGIVEIGAGILTGSQALKADSLDFLGDGLVSLLALIAIRWTLRSRAKVAFGQGLFLGLLGLGVLVQTLRDFSHPTVPEGGMILTFGLAALAVNVISALILIPYRKGDASAEAVWLFGSAARGDGTDESDIDIMVIRQEAVAESDAQWRTQLSDLAAKVTAWTGNSCEILELSGQDLAAQVTQRTRLVTEVRRDAIPLGGKAPATLLD